MADTTHKPSSTASARKIYLTAYNILFATLWTSIFIKAISNAANSKLRLFSATETPARWIQTASLIEVVHSATGTFPLRFLTHQPNSPPSRAYQISCQHHRFASCDARHSGMDGMV
jgi:hypothetical protein